MFTTNYFTPRLVIVILVIGATTIAGLWFIVRPSASERAVDGDGRPVTAKETELADDVAWMKLGPEIVRRSIPLDELFLSIGDKEKVVAHPGYWAVDRQDWSDWHLPLATSSGTYVTFLRSSMEHISASWRVLMDERARGMSVGRILAETGSDPAHEVCCRVVGHKPMNDRYAGSSGLVSYKTVEIEFTIRRTVDNENMTKIVGWAERVADCLVRNYVIVGGR